MLEKNLDKWIVGAALVLTASTLLPIVKSTLRPIAQNGMQGTAGLLARGRTAMQLAREEIEDIVAEARFERMKKQFDKDIFSMDADHLQ
jgi:hypothetical protein